MQQKAGLSEDMLQCGVHLPGDPEMFRSFVAAGRAPTPNFNNCSGKHTAMLAHARMRGLPLDTYLDRSHPIQRDILVTFAEMCGMDPSAVALGIDGCSAPNFAVPLYNAALAMARLCDPAQLAAPRREACLKITRAMAAHPEMISASGEFDCELMRTGEGRLFTKRGAEGFQILGLRRGVLEAGSPGVGIAFKVSDGDASRMSMQLESTSRVRPAVALEILQQLRALSAEQQKTLARFGPMKELKNHRGIVTGFSRPAFQLERHG
jgi:L-asparaginase II